MKKAKCIKENKYSGFIKDEIYELQPVFEGAGTHVEGNLIANGVKIKATIMDSQYVNEYFEYL